MLIRAFATARLAACLGLLPLCATAAGLLLSPNAALAHAHLQSANPPTEGTTDTPPSAVTLTFTEPLEPRFSSIEVKDAQGKRVDDGKPHSASGDGKSFAIGVGRLVPGIYTVDWHATSIDTHRTEGSFHFTVK